jgi:hypothetical protein
MILQASIDLWLIFSNNDRETEDHLAISEPAGALCLVCHPHGIDHGVGVAGKDLVYFTLRRDTLRMLLGHLRLQQDPESEKPWINHPGIYQVAGTQDELRKLQMIVLDDVWANEPGLSATDQLLVRACVRRDLLDWFVELSPVSEETGLDEKGGTY